MISELETVCTEHCSQTARLLNIITDHTHFFLTQPCLVRYCLKARVTIFFRSLNQFFSSLYPPLAWEQPLNLMLVLGVTMHSSGQYIDAYSPCSETCVFLTQLLNFPPSLESY